MNCDGHATGARNLTTLTTWSGLHRPRSDLDNGEGDLALQWGQGCRCWARRRARTFCGRGRRVRGSSPTRCTRRDGHGRAVGRPLDTLPPSMSGPSSSPGWRGRRPPEAMRGTLMGLRALRFGSRSPGPRKARRRWKNAVAEESKSTRPRPPWRASQAITGRGGQNDLPNAASAVQPRTEDLVTVESQEINAVASMPGQTARSRSSGERKGFGKV